jgi:hypothetical protein
MDLGFRESAKRHASGGFYGSGISQERDGIFSAPPNFSSTPYALTTSFFNKARMEIEAALSNIHGCKIFNLSDGVQIEGAEAVHSRELELDDYIAKQTDLEAIIRSFSPAERGVNWEYFNVPGSELLKEYKMLVLDSLQMTDFDISVLTHKMDSVLSVIVQVMNSREGGIRMELYLKLTLDLLAILYRFLLFAHSDAERLKVYKTGMIHLEKIFDELKWPDKLDFCE